MTATYKLTELRQAVAAIRRLGQYRLFERIGQGGMGEVFRAQHMFLRRPCAIKLIRDDTQDGGGMSRQVQRFERECKPPPACITPTSSTSMTTDGPKTAPSITSWVPAGPVAGAACPTAMVRCRRDALSIFCGRPARRWPDARGWSDPSRHQAEQPVCLLSSAR